MNTRTLPLKCINGTRGDCARCGVNGNLNCRFRWSDWLFFWLPIFIFFLASGYGMSQAGYVTAILIYMAMFVFIFFVGAPAFLCRHCPYYGEPGFFIQCGAHYGSIKLFKYSPTPLNKLEKMCVHGTFLPLFGYPLVFLALGGQWFCLAIATLGLAKWSLDMVKITCARCVNLECPLNRVPQQTARFYRVIGKAGTAVNP
jgi:hypothetical protein